MQSLQTQQWLQEIGLSSWLIRSPDIFAQAPQLSKKFTIEADCKLLLVVAAQINYRQSDGTVTHLLTNILKAMNLTLEQVKQISINGVPFIEQHQLKWCWFCGVEQVPIIAPMTGETHIIVSPTLNTISQNTHEKRALWTQIQQPCHK